MNATVYPIPSRVEDELLRKQDARTEWMFEAAAYVKRCRTVDRLSGIDWAIAASGTVAGPTSPGADVSLVSAIRGPSTIARSAS